MSGPPRRVAVVGAGIAGLAAAQVLSEASRAGRCEVTLFEAGEYFGGHTHTVDVTLPGQDGRPVRAGVDTGFLVFNDRTYPQLVELFERLDIDTAPSDMSFSVQVPDRRLEWSGSDLNTVFAQRRNLLRPRFLGMLREILRFNRLATDMAASGESDALDQPLGDFLDEHRFSRAFRDWYFLPMIGCIWSCPTDQMLRFPVSTMLRFCHNHGLIQVSDRPQWHTVRGGARQYVPRMLAHVAHSRLRCPVTQVCRVPGGVIVTSRRGAEWFDAAVLACHSDQSLAMLVDATARERELLSAIGYHRNRAVLHTDTALLPRRRLAHAAWNYERAESSQREHAAVCLHYLINRLQPLPFAQDVIVSLNPVREPASSQVIDEFEYEHPVFDLAALRAQRALPLIQGQRNTWFCGAWTGYGFHEDGLKSGQAAAREVLAMQTGAAHAASCAP